MVNGPYPRHHRSEVDVAASAHSLFALLDDHSRLASHMEKSSLMTAGSTMKVETDALHGQAVGSVIRVTGRVHGMNLADEEVVNERQPPFHKTWETRSEPRLLVIGPYRMGFTIGPSGIHSRLEASIDYRLPPHGFSRWLGHLFAWSYAAWCTRRMADDAMAAFGGGAA